MKKYLVLFLLFSVIFISCSNNEEDEYVDIIADNPTDDINILSLPATPFNYANIVLPNSFQNNAVRNEDNTPINNPITDHGATLGRVLFYDKNLSKNSTISCASCHVQANGFSDPNKFSTGFEGGLTGRNSMGLANARFYQNGRFFWDERAETLEEQTLMPVQDLVEMGLTLTELEDKLSQEEYYTSLFTNAFGDATITSERVALALSQFIRSMVSFESKFDEGLAQVNNIINDFPNFTASENRGKALFISNRSRCFDCHNTTVFVGDAPRNIGLDSIITDGGAGGGRFKVPSLRNIELTAPYMHDGRFSNLEQVIEHYNSGVQNSPNLDNRLRQGNGVRRLNLSDAEKQSLVDFLLTLTDNNFITDEKYGNPFIE
ncbi:cytochrome-c peroxidase [Tenacibaculum sp. SZ-18]|uniref:cytochrome-c peroxidase n=1 Tax=Tenacibaculum sp. SZ-18 TaxID=754423 RepID=UPI000C2D091C|nr:cytochrome c peroxidase [Tenacibaculum sp. SZ-18]AUC14787.1 cytochrome-c peroxidase [Tenacibaculum sp. SZ-18]